MMTKITPRDWEALSAYLDNEIAPKERLRLEARLKADQAFAAALEEVRRTRTVLKSQPRLRAPRNFTLTPQMAGAHPGKQSQPTLYPMLRLASVLATIFFLIILAGDLLAGRQQAFQLAQAPRSAVATSGGVEAPYDTVIAEAAPTAQSQESFKAVLPTPTAIPPSALQVPQALTETTATSVPPLALAPSAKEPEAQGLGGGPGANLQPTPSPEAGRTDITMPILRVLQVLLGLLAIGTGVGALLLRRSMNR